MHQSSFLLLNQINHYYYKIVNEQYAVSTDSRLRLKSVRKESRRLATATA